MHATGGIFSNIMAEGSEFHNVKVTVFYESNNTPFQPCASANFGYRNKELYIYSTTNVKSISRVHEGCFRIIFEKAISVKAFYDKNREKHFVDLYCLGNGTSEADSANPLIIFSGFITQSLEYNNISVNSDGIAKIPFINIYTDDNNYDAPIAPYTVQVMIISSSTGVF